VLPPEDESVPRYQPTVFDRLGPDGVLHARAGLSGAIAFLVLFLILMLASPTRKFTSRHPISTSLFGALAGAYLVYWTQTRSAAAAGAVAKAMTFPDGSHTPYEEQYSFQESLVARGDMAAALEAYEKVIAEQPGRAAPRLRAAEHYARGARDARRAAELFREVRDFPDVSTRDAVYASSRLADLYDGPLGEPGRALVELRRIIERYPGTAVAAHARAALPKLKSRLAAEQGASGSGTA
jgi:tetratricopeptide (TPR) repeat protein